MAFYFALFNVSSVNLEENAKKSKYKELNKKSSRQRCRSADGRMKVKTQLSTDAKQMQVRRVPKNLHTDIGGSLESLHNKNKSNDYRTQLSKPQVVEVYNGRKISAPTAVHLPRSRLPSATDSVGTATSLANGDIRKDDDSAFEHTGVNLARRGSTPSYKRVTFRYSGDATTTVTLREEPSISQELERISKYPLSKDHPLNQHSMPKPTQTPSTAVAQNSSSFSSRFLGKLSCTSPKIKRHATWHVANNRRPLQPIPATTTLILPKTSTSTSPLNKLRAIIKKLIVENRRKKIINSLKQAAVLYQQQEQTENEQRVQSQQQQTKWQPSDQQTKFQQLEQQTKRQPLDQQEKWKQLDLQTKRPVLDKCHLESPAIDNLALETLQNLQNQTMEENLKDQRRSTVGTAAQAPKVHRHSLFGQSWSRREEQQVTMEKDEHRWMLSLRRTPSTTNKRNSAEIKMKRRSATIMETDLSTENENSKNPPNQIRATERQNRQSKNNRTQSKEKDQPQQQEQHQLEQQQSKNINQVVRRRSTTDKSRSPSTFKNLGAWSLLKSKRRSCSSTSQQSSQTDEEWSKLLPIYDENGNPCFSTPISNDHRHAYGWVPPINGYVNPLFVSLSAPNSPAHVRMRDKKKPKNKCPIDKRIDQRISLIETDLTFNQRNRPSLQKPKMSWWNRVH